MTDDEIINETVDAEGTRVVLLTRIWREKLLPEHVELADFMGDALEAVTSAEHVEVDPVYPERRAVLCPRCGSQPVAAGRRKL